MAAMSFYHRGLANALLFSPTLTDGQIKHVPHHQLGPSGKPPSPTLFLLPTRRLALSPRHSASGSTTILPGPNSIVPPKNVYFSDRKRHGIFTHGPLVGLVVTHPHAIRFIRHLSPLRTCHPTFTALSSPVHAHITMILVAPSPRSCLLSLRSISPPESLLYPTPLAGPFFLSTI